MTKIDIWKDKTKDHNLQIWKHPKESLHQGIVHHDSYHRVHYTHIMVKLEINNF